MSYTLQAYKAAESTPGITKTELRAVVRGVAKFDTMLWRMVKEKMLRVADDHGTLRYYPGPTQPSGHGRGGRRKLIVQHVTPQPVAAAMPVKQAPAPAQVVSLDAIAERFATGLAERITQMVLASLDKATRAVTMQPPKAPPVAESVYRLPRIGVVGLLPQQAGQIQTEFCDTFDITFWNDKNGSSLPQLKALGARCEVVFIHTDHCRHATDETLKQTGAKIMRVPGGISAMRDAITEYYVKRGEQ